MRGSVYEVTVDFVHSPIPKLNWMSMLCTHKNSFSSGIKQ